MKQSAFGAALEREDFAAALALLKQSLREAQVVNPRQDETWAPASDQLGYAILASRGAVACRKYWEELLRYFREELEKSWGHTHKGHGYFRLGFAWLGSNLGKARAIIQQAVSEDELFERTQQRRLGARVPMEDAMARYPSHVFLQFLDLIQDGALLSGELRRSFFRGLVPTHWDVIWGPKPVDERLVRAAVRHVVSGPMTGRALQLLAGVNMAFVARNAVGLISSCASLVDALAFDRLMLQSARRAPQGSRARPPTTTELLAEAWKRDSFLRESTWATLQCADLLARSLSRTQGRRAHSDSVMVAMGVGIKILVDLALVEWMNDTKDNASA